VTLARGTLRRPKAATSIGGALAARLRARLLETGAAEAAFAWPSPKYQADPLAFGREVLGVELWDRQVEILEAVRDHQFVAVRGGRKVGKDFALAILALWFFCSYPKARVRFTAVRMEQVEDVFWLQIRQLLAEHGRCVACKALDPHGPRPCPHSHLIPEEPGIKAGTGLRSADFREIVGMTTRTAEGAAGLSGTHQLNIADEASAVEDFFFETIMGNMGGCIVGRLALISNPTRNHGEFWRAFHDKSSHYHPIHISSRTSPNVLAGRLVVPGLATREWIETMTEKYREGSDFVRIHVDGDFAQSEAGTIFSIHDIEEAQKRWPTAPSDGPLFIGVDVAGESGTGDESAFAARRDQKILSLHTRIGLSPEAHLIEVLGLVAKWGGDKETTVVIDKGGEAGAKVWGTFVAHHEQNWKDARFKIVGVRSSDKALRDAKSYDKVRDELVANLADWVHDGGGIPEDARLAVELNAFRWQEQRLDTRNKLVDKIKMRGQIGRSPDRADAVALSVWSAPARTEIKQAPQEADGGLPRRPTEAVDGRDPYALAGAFDPWSFHDQMGRRR
jgi:phage terminase large subunit